MKTLCIYYLIFKYTENYIEFFHYHYNHFLENAVIFPYVFTLQAKL